MSPGGSEETHWRQGGSDCRPGVFTASVAIAQGTETGAQAKVTGARATMWGYKNKRKNKERKK